MTQFHRLYKPISGIILTLMLASCASHSPEISTPQSHLEKALEQNKEAEKLKVPDAVNQALMNSNSSQPSQQPKEQKINVSVNDAPARAFFLSLVADAGVNVVASPDIEGQITLDLHNVTVKEVLNVVRDVYGYEYKYNNGIYTIYPRKMRTEIFPINYLDVQRVGVTDTSVLIGKINSQNSSNQNGGQSNQNNNNSNNSGDSANLLNYLDLGKNKSGQSQELTPGSRVQTLSKTDFWKNLHETLIGIIGGETDGRMVMTSAQSGMVVVRALPRELNTVRDFLERSELSVKRQVVLETKILEVQLNDDYEAGINWSAISGELSLESNTSGQDSISEVLWGKRGVTQTMFSSTLQVTDITKLISLLDQQGNVQVLSSPRISTVNNQKAIIRVGSDEFFVTGISNSTTASAAAVTNTPDIQLSSFFSGISLDVTPQIAADGDVILHVHPIVSNVQDQLKEIKVGNNNFSLPLALRDVRESDSIVRASSGQVVVLGGLMQEVSNDVSTRRGALGRIPVAEILFKHKKKLTHKNELVILMRPIVVEDQTWDQQLEEGAARMEDINEAMKKRD